MNNKPSTPSTPARWERWLAAVISLTLLCTPPVTAVIGLIAYAAARKRHAFFAGHVLHLVLWQLVFSLVVVDFGLITRLLPAGSAWVKLNQTSFVPQRALWASATTGEQVVIAIFCAFMAFNIAIMVQSLLAALRHRPFYAPVLGWLVREKPSA